MGRMAFWLESKSTRICGPGVFALSLAKDGVEGRSERLKVWMKREGRKGNGCVSGSLKVSRAMEGERKGKLIVKQ